MKLTVFKQRMHAIIKAKGTLLDVHFEVYHYQMNPQLKTTSALVVVTEGISGRCIILQP